MTEQVDFLLTGGFIVTMNKSFDLFPHGAIAVREETIVAVGPAEDINSNYQAREVVDCTGRVMIPGLVNAHTHIPMSLLRGLNDDLRLDVWLGYLKIGRAHV